MTDPIREECAAIAARERRDEVLDALAGALMDADRIHQPGACICRHGDGFSVVLEPYVEHDIVIDVDGNPVDVSRGARLALLHALGGVPATEPEAEPEPEPDSWERLEEDARKINYERYWGCKDAETCATCPAKVDGVMPHDRYRVGHCDTAMVCDIVRRARALAGVVGDES